MRTKYSADSLMHENDAPASAESTKKKDEQAGSLSSSDEELDLTLPVSDPEEEPMVEQPHEKGDRSQPEKQLQESGRKPHIVEILGSTKVGKSVIHLARVRDRREPITVPASYVNQHFPQVKWNGRFEV